MAEANSLNIKIENDHQLPTLYEVSVQGDVAGLKRLIREDALALDRASVVTFCSETPLHIAAIRGHSEFARELVQLKPELAGESDSLGRVPLHWACEKGFTDIVKELLRKRPDACFLRDHEGRVPLHLAVMKGRNDVVSEMVKTSPKSIGQKVEDGGTILHLCVKYNNLDGLKLLVKTRKGSALVNAMDDHGNTVLHLAVIFKRVEITKYLLSENTGIHENELNMNGFTALDAAEHSAVDSKAMEIKILLLEAGVQKRTTRNLNNPVPKTSESTHSRWYQLGSRFKTWWNDKYMKNVGIRLEQARGNLLVAATVTATMAFQAGIQPPFKDETPVQTQGTASAPVYSGSDSEYGHPDLFWILNSLSLILSLSIILMMLSGIPFRNKLTNVALVIAMSGTVASISGAYYYAVEKEVDQDLLPLLKILPGSILGIFYLIMFVHVVTFIVHFVIKMFKHLKKLFFCYYPRKVAS